MIAATRWVLAAVGAFALIACSGGDDDGGGGSCDPSSADERCSVSNGVAVRLVCSGALSTYVIAEICTAPTTCVLQASLQGRDTTRCALAGGADIAFGADAGGLPPQDASDGAAVDDGAEGDGAPPGDAAPDGTTGGADAWADTSAPHDAGDAAAPDAGQDATVDAGPPEPCGDGVCAIDEGPISCPQDCGPGAMGCGNGACGSDESFNSCAIDCSPIGAAVYGCLQKSCTVDTALCIQDSGCNDQLNLVARCIALCPSGAAGGVCIDDCVALMQQSALTQSLAACGLGPCKTATTGGAAVCGNGSCEPGEGPATCAADCAPAGPVCGDGVCAGGESSATCPADCGGGGGGGHCGDGTCAGETAAQCPVDCDASAASTWSCMDSDCPGEAAACKQDPACGAALNEAALCALACAPGDESCLQGCQGAVLGNSTALSLGLCALNTCLAP